MQVSITVNGVVRERDVDPRTLLVHFLREELDLTGTKIGCDTSQCDAPAPFIWMARYSNPARSSPCKPTART